MRDDLPPTVQIGQVPETCWISRVGRRQIQGEAEAFEVLLAEHRRVPGPTGGIR
jgi:hypothetical protein